jgi:hypothetical protein
VRTVPAAQKIQVAQMVPVGRMAPVVPIELEAQLGLEARLALAARIEPVALMVLVVQTALARMLVPLAALTEIRRNIDCPSRKCPVGDLIQSA